MLSSQWEVISLNLIFSIENKVCHADSYTAKNPEKKICPFLKNEHFFLKMSIFFSKWAFFFSNRRITRKGQIFSQHFLQCRFSEFVTQTKLVFSLPSYVMFVSYTERNRKKISVKFCVSQNVPIFSSKWSNNSPILRKQMGKFREKYNIFPEIFSRFLPVYMCREFLQL